MKNWFSKHKFRISVGLIMIVAAIVLGIIFSSFLDVEPGDIRMYLYFFFVFGTGISGLSGIACGKWGFAYGYALILLIILPIALPKPYNSYFGFLYFACLFVVPYLKMKKNKAGKKKDENGETAALSDGDEEDEPFNEGDNNENFILCYNNLSGRYYVVFRRGGMLYANFVGGELGGPKYELLLSATDPTRKNNKKDIAIAIEDIKNIKVKSLGTAGYSYNARIKTGKKSYLFLYRGDEDDKFVEFWRSISQEEVLDKETLAELNEAAPDEKRLKIANKFKVVYAGYVILVSLCWLFLSVPYGIFAFLNMLSLPLGIILCAIFKNEMTILEVKSTTKKCSVSMPLMFSGFALLLRTMLDFNILNWGRLFVVAGIIFLVILAFYMLAAKEWKKKKSAFVIIIFALLFYGIGTAMELNVLLDFNEPVVEEAVIQEMRISTGSNSPDSYIIDVVKENGESQSIEISESDYDMLDVGDGVEVYTYPGLFGIGYAIAE